MIIRRRATHETGHAVFMWRRGERLYGDDFFDNMALFSEIIVSPHPWDADDNLPPLALADGRLHEAAETVVAAVAIALRYQIGAP